MKEELLKDAQLVNKEIEAKKISFRQYQRNLPFGEKMQITFALRQTRQNYNALFFCLNE